MKVPSALKSLPAKEQQTVERFLRMYAFIEKRFEDIDGSDANKFAAADADDALQHGSVYKTFENMVKGKRSDGAVGGRRKKRRISSSQ